MPLFGPDIKKMKEKRDFQGLIRELRHKNPKTRLEVVDALSELEHVEGLREATENDNSEVCVRATRALANLKCTDALLVALESKDPEVRIAAIEGLRHARDPKTAERDASEPDVKLNRSLQETLNNLYYI